MPPTAEEASIPLPGPWEVLHIWPEATVVSVTGGPGTGKSTLLAMLKPDLWATAEQTPRRAVVTLVRAQRAIAEEYERRDIAPIKTPRDVEARLVDLPGGLFALDSLTRVGAWDEQVRILEVIAEWTHAGEGRRAVVILQHNKRHEGAGLNSVPHLVDACLDVYQDISGLRVLSCWKNRSGDPTARYFQLGADGVRSPDFGRAAWSVEGDAGAYTLHPWPLRGAMWGGVLDALFGRGGRELGVAVPGIAGCGIYQPGYPRNVLEPGDVEQRQRFAEAHGLTWWTERWPEGLPDPVHPDPKVVEFPGGTRVEST